MRVTDEEYAEILKRPGVRGVESGEMAGGEISGAQAAMCGDYDQGPKRRAPKRKTKKKKIAPVKRKGDQKMTKTEREYAAKYLDPLVRSGELVRYDYERKKFILANRCEYTPDFYCVYPTHIELVEVKGGYANKNGRNTRDGRTRWKVAAEENPEFVWKYATKTEGGEWKIEVYES